MNLLGKNSRLTKIDQTQHSQSKAIVLWSETVEMTLLQERQEEILGASRLAVGNVDIVV